MVYGLWFTLKLQLKLKLEAEPYCYTIHNTIKINLSASAVFVDLVTIEVGTQTKPNQTKPNQRRRRCGGEGF
jgi:hypothetical protein